MKVGIIGFGQIGSFLFRKLTESNVGFIYEIDPQKTKGINGDLLVEDPEHLRKQKVDLVVEAADFRAVTSLASEILQQNDMLILSASALANQKLYGNLQKICAENGTRIYIPHGAVLGMDGLQDGRDVFQEVSITTTKHPRNIDFSFAGSLKPRNTKEETTLFEGSTRKICSLFPRNVNTHAVVALSSLGFDRTRSKLIADPNHSVATHQIIAKSGNLVLKIEASSKIRGVSGDYTLASVYGTLKRILTKRVVNIV